MKESTLQAQIKGHLENCKWVAYNMHGNRYQAGIPDLYCWSNTHGQRWVEVKRKNYKFTEDQLRVFPTIEGAGIWILQSPQDYNNGVLFRKPNWRDFLKPRDLKIIEAFENERQRKRGIDPNQTGSDHTGTRGRNHSSVRASRLLDKLASYKVQKRGSA